MKCSPRMLGTINLQPVWHKHATTQLTVAARLQKFVGQVENWTFVGQF